MARDWGRWGEGDRRSFKKSEGGFGAVVGESTEILEKGVKAWGPPDSKIRTGQLERNELTPSGMRRGT